MDMFLLAVGGSLGAIARYLLGLVVMKKYSHPQIPMAMVVVNVLGSFGLGAFFALYFQQIPLMVPGDGWFLILGTGFFGAFTTFSTFSVEAIELLQKHYYKQLVVYVSLSLLGSIVSFGLGYFIFT